MVVIATEGRKMKAASMTKLAPPADPETAATYLSAPRKEMPRRRVAFLVFDGVEIVDLCAPMDVFHYADRWVELNTQQEPGYEILLVGASAGPFKTSFGLEIIATCGCDDALGEIDTVVVPGSPWIEKVCAEPRLIAWLQRTTPGVRRLVSVCTGAFMLAAAGLLKNRNATTHWMYCDQLGLVHPSSRILRDRIFVRDGNVYTSGGITAGIDLALSLIEEDMGQEAARFVAGSMVMFLRRPGGQNQFSFYLQAEASNRSDIRDLQAWIVANPNEDHAVERLAARINMSPRNFARQFLSESRMTPAKFVERARLEAARCKLEQTNLLIEAIAAQTGFGSAERMQRTFQRLLNVSPQDYRARFQSTARLEEWAGHDQSSFSSWGE